MPFSHDAYAMQHDHGRHIFLQPRYPWWRLAHGNHHIPVALADGSTACMYCHEVLSKPHRDVDRQMRMEAFS